MYEVAFKVKPDSDFYEKYKVMKREEKHCWNLAKDFMEQHGLENCQWYQSKRLTLGKLSKEQEESLGNQLLKQTDRNSMRSVRASSKLQKSWEKEVVCNVDWEALELRHFWWLDWMSHGSYSLWNDGEDVYGLICNKSAADEPRQEQIPAYAQVIPMSQYYKAMEDYESKKKEVQE